MNNLIRNAFKVLEIKENIKLSDAKQAYIDLIKVWHPDKHSPDSRLWEKANIKTKELNEAWSIVEKYLTSDILEEEDIVNNVWEREAFRKAEDYLREEKSAKKKEYEKRKQEVKNCETIKSEDNPSSIELKNEVYERKKLALFQFCMLLFLLMFFPSIKGTFLQFFGKAFYYLIAVLSTYFFFSRLYDNFENISHMSSFVEKRRD